jgi:hypothetical protein
MDNNRRADLGLEAVRAAAESTNVWNVEDAETSITDVLSYIAHLCDACGMVPEHVFNSALTSYEGDSEDGPPAKVKYRRDLAFPQQLPWQDR